MVPKVVRPELLTVTSRMLKELFTRLSVLSFHIGKSDAWLFRFSSMAYSIPRTDSSSPMLSDPLFLRYCCQEQLEQDEEEK